VVIYSLRNHNKFTVTMTVLHLICEYRITYVVMVVVVAPFPPPTPHWRRWRCWRRVTRMWCGVVVDRVVVAIVAIVAAAAAACAAEQHHVVAAADQRVRKPTVKVHPRKRGPEGATKVECDKHVRASVSARCNTHVYLSLLLLLLCCLLLLLPR
jgi:hypothetical protein